MAEALFKVIAQGPAPGRPPEEVRKNLAALFNNNPKQAEVFFQGKPVVVKQGLNQPEALKYQKALEKAGVLVKVMPVQAPPKKPSAAPAADRKRMTCPKCGFEQDE
ncbi:MAG: hypothetical protein AB1896_19390, partial [Thermodesulfobacteriota bacterium]